MYETETAETILTFKDAKLQMEMEHWQRSEPSRWGGGKGDSWYESFETKIDTRVFWKLIILVVGKKMLPNSIRQRLVYGIANQAQRYDKPVMTDEEERLLWNRCFQTSDLPKWQQKLNRWHRWLQSPCFFISFTEKVEIPFVKIEEGPYEEEQ